MSREVINPDELVNGTLYTLPELTPLIDTFNLLSDPNQRLAFLITQEQGNDRYSLSAAAGYPYQDIASLMIQISREGVSLYFLAASFQELDHLLAHEEDESMPLLGSIRYGPRKVIWKQDYEEVDGDLDLIDAWGFAINVFEIEDATKESKDWCNMACLLFANNSANYMREQNAITVLKGYQVKFDEIEIGHLEALLEILHTEELR